MIDLERQIRAYAETLDESAPSLDVLVAAAAPPRARPRRTPVWAMVAAAAAVVVMVGSVAALTSLRSPADVTATTAQPTTTAAAVSSTTEPEGGTTIASPPSPSEYVSLISPTPAYAGGADGDVDGRPRVDAGPIVEVDGVYHVLFAAGGEDDVWEAVFHGTSSDGSTWRISDAPVEFDAVRGASDLLIGSLAPLDDGTWAMYYHVAFDSGGHGDHVFEYSIGRATAPGPEGPWSADPTPALTPGPAGSWDAGSVRYPEVVRHGDSWLMFYAGGSGKDDAGEPGPGAVGLATSRDGIAWAKLTEPVFVGDPLRGWEDGSVARIDVAWVGDRYLLLYAGRTGGSRGLATSPDGIAWERVSGDPVLTGFDVPRPAIFSTSMLVDDGRIRLYVANGGYRTTSAVYEMELTPP